MLMYTTECGPASLEHIVSLDRYSIAVLTFTAADLQDESFGTMTKLKDIQNGLECF